MPRSCRRRPAATQPHAELTGDRSPLRVLKKGEPWPAGRPLRAGVSAMGFGGINAHVVLESIDRTAASRVEPAASGPLLDSSQDAELFLLDGRDAADLRRRVVELLEIAGQLSMAELTDLAAHLAAVARRSGWPAPRSSPADRPSWRPGSNRCGSWLDQEVGPTRERRWPA